MQLTPPEKLKNRLEVLINPVRHLHSVCVGIAVKCGSVYETPKTNGAFHFIEHLLFEGTKQRDSDAIKEAFIINKDDFNADTYFEATRLYFNAPTRKAPKAMELLSDMLQNSEFDKSEVEAERGPILNEISGTTDMHQYYLTDTATSLLFEGQPAGMPVAGTKENVQSLTRDELFKMYYDYYTPRSVVVSVYGNISYDGARSLLEEHFGNFKRPDNDFDAPDAALPAAYRKVAIKRPGLEDTQSNLQFALPGTRRLSANGRKDIPAIRLLGYILDQRIGDKVEERLTLSRSHISDTSVFQASSFSLLTVNFAAGVEAAGKIERTILSEAEKIRHGDISKKDFDIAKAQYLVFGREIQDKPFDFSPALAEDMITNKVDYGKLYSTVKEELSLDDVKGAAQRYLDRDKALLLTLVPEH